MEYYFNLRIGNKCNLKCRHCFCEGSPEGGIMEFDDVKKILHNLPKETTYLCITGGEPTIVPYFNDLLKYIKKNKNELFYDCEIRIQTNGWWVKDSSQLETELLNFKELGVDSIRWSAGKYHKEQGIDIDRIRSDYLGVAYKWNNKYNGKENFPIKLIWHKIFDSFKPIRVGRAKNLDNEKALDKWDCMIFKYGEDVTWLNINPKGNIFLCAYETTPILGNVINDSVLNVLNNSLKNPFIKAFKEKGVEGLARKLRKYSKYKKSDYKHKNCLICKELFEEIEV